MGCSDEMKFSEESFDKSELLSPGSSNFDAITQKRTSDFRSCSDQKFILYQKKRLLHSLHVGVIVCSNTAFSGRKDFLGLSRTIKF